MQPPIEHRGRVYLPVSIVSPDDISTDPIQVTITPIWNAHAAADDPSYQWVTPTNVAGLGWAILVGPDGFELVRGEMYALLVVITDNPGPEVPVLQAGVFRAT